VSASATPTATSLPCASPEAVVIADAFCSAFTSTAPETLRRTPAPSQARVVTFESAIATAGTTETPPPDAPVLAVVVIAWLVVAETAAFAPPRTVASSSIAASVVSSTIDSATAAPTPTSAAPTTPPSSPGSASTVEVEWETARIEMLPEPALTTEPPLSSARVSTRTMLSASEPATPTLPPPAPDFASAPNSWLEPISASTAMPCAEMLAPLETNASLRTSTRLIATPAPMDAVLPPGCTALPSAAAAESVLALVRRVNWPPATTVTPETT
jgi:hypothetical protein